ncbi:hypothetical protein OHC33_003031, partial [Knufia fluminis]
EAASVSIALDDEDPWMLARLIQYLYYDVYQGHQDDYLRDAAGALNLPGMMRQFSHTDIRSDAEADHQRNSCMIHCMMAKMGERYGVPLLIYVAAARMHTAFNSDPPQGSVEDQFWSLCQTLGSEALFRHVMVQSALTHMVTTHFSQLGSPRLRKWCDDHGLAYCIAQSISERLSRIQQKAPNDPSRDEGSGSTASDTSPGGVEEMLSTGPMEAVQSTGEGLTRR